MNDLYFECNSGISGDMAVAALLDLGADKVALQNALDSIEAQGFKTEITRVNKSGIDCCDFNVILDSAHENNDHDMHYLFGHEDAAVESIETTLAEHHSEEPHNHHHEHRNLSDVLAIIEKTQMTCDARKLAYKIFEIIAQAESVAHNLPVDKVHFHEVGALDSIVDVIAFAVCFDSLKINRVFVPILNEGTGTVRCQHGILPIPVPAVANIVQKYELPLNIMSEKGEFITPTGAAFVAAVMTDKVLPSAFTIKKIGLGVGKRTYEMPSILRAILIEDIATNASEISENKITKLETNIDDCTSETLGFVMEKLLEQGAFEVNYIPCFMKKNRPSYLLTVICTENSRPKLEEIIFQNTTTIGIRRSLMQRTILNRKELELESPYGKIRAKEVWGFGVKRILPEYDDVAKIAQESKKSFLEIYSELADLCKKSQATIGCNHSEATNTSF